MIQLIGLYSSTQQSGKSTVSDHLETFGYSTAKCAGPLKDMLRVLLFSMGFDDDVIKRMMEGDLKEETIPGLEKSPRDLMISLGTGWGREQVDPNLWTIVLGSHLREKARRGALVVVDDVRFPNEYATIRALGGKMVRVVRPSMIPGTSVCDGLLDTYPFDAAILNDGSLMRLRATARSVFKCLAEEMP